MNFSEPQNIQSATPRHTNGEEMEEIDLKELLQTAVDHWRWFLVGVLAALLLAGVYLWQATPLYEVEATVIINEEGQPSVNLGGLEQMLMMRTPKGNLDNEIEILQSYSSLYTTVEELGLYITTWDENSLLSRELYQDRPLRVDLSSLEAQKLLDPIEITYTIPANESSVQVLALSKGKKDEEWQREATFTQLPAVLSTPKGNITFSLTPESPLALQHSNVPGERKQEEQHIKKGKTLNATVSDVVSKEEPKELTAAGSMVSKTKKKAKDKKYKVLIQSPQQTTKVFLKKLTILPTDKKTTIAKLTLQDNIPQRGMGFLTQLIQVYNRRANESKNEIAKKTEQFIDQRIQIIDKELGSTEEQLEQFKRSARLTDITSDAQLALSESSEYEKKRVENETQIQLIKALNEYIQRQGNNPEILPVNVGITNPSLGALIGQFNELVIERSRLLKSSSETNPAVINVNLTLESLLASIKATVTSVQNGLLITKQALDEQAGIFTQRISDAPTQERKYVSISRQQEIKSGLYLMLLQKREENAIALAATEDFARVIDAPMLVGTGPVAPKKMMILAGALFLGLLLPGLVVALKEFFQTKIKGLEEVERRCPQIPIVGKLHQEEGLTSPIVVRPNENTLLTERFRDLRTNLLFILGEAKQQVVLVTSTTAGEGKTFTSVNLATSLSLLNKRILLVGLDIRKPQMARIFNFELKSKGITDYLSNPKLPIQNFIQSIPGYPHLEVLPTGSIPPNPTELLTKVALDELFQELRKSYDYIVVDTAPVGLVSDTRLVSRVVDTSLFVCKANYSYKTSLELINQLHETHQLPRLNLVVNGLDLDRMKRYGYGYGSYGHVAKSSKKRPTHG